VLPFGGIAIAVFTNAVQIRPGGSIQV